MRVVSSPALRLIFLNSGIALAYFALGKLGLLMALPPGYSSPIWPAAGVAFASCLIWGGKRVWPGILLGSAMTNASAAGHFDLGWLPWAIATGSTLQALIGERVLRRLDPGLEFDRAFNIARFSIATLSTCVIAAMIGNAALLAKGIIASDSQLAQSLITWWLGDVLGVQIFTVLGLVLFDRREVWADRRIQVGVPLLIVFILCGIIHAYPVYTQDHNL